jgi:hypothetical protein
MRGVADKNDGGGHGVIGTGLKRMFICRLTARKERGSMVDKPRPLSQSARGSLRLRHDS